MSSVTYEDLSVCYSSRLFKTIYGRHFHWNDHQKSI